MNGIPASLIDNLVNDFTKPTLPNVCFIIDCPAEESHKRIKKRGILNDYDNQSVEYFHKIRKGFLNRPTNNKLYPYYVIENNILETTVKQIIDIFNSISEL